MLNNKRTILEEIGNSVTHGIGIVLLIIGVILFYLFHQHISGLEKILGTAIFFACLFLMYIISTLFHSLAFTKAKYVFSILDHSVIFLLIAGTYTPFLLIAQKSMINMIFLGSLWLLTVIGITLKAVFFGRSRVFSLVIFLLFGWSILLIKPLWFSLSPATEILLLSGGLCYTVGIPFYLLKRLPFNHMVWHLFVLGGSIFHFLAIYFYV